jgi:DNA repair protein RecO (recombination protein O)
MPTFKTAALVLRAYDFSEADRVLVLFTRGLGKVKGVARGVRRTASRLNGCLGWLSLSDLQLAARTEPTELYRITQGQLLHAYPRLKENLAALGRAARMAEILFALTPDHQPLPEIFELAETALKLWDAGISPALAGVWFEWMFLERMGHRPRVERCRDCGSESGVLAYRAEHDGVTCRACSSQGGLVLSAGTRRVLARVISAHPALLPRLALSAENEHEIQALLDAVWRAHLGRPLKSESFQRAVEELEG